MNGKSLPPLVQPPPGTFTVQPGSQMQMVPIGAPIITNQPGVQGAIWMAMPQQIDGCPPGLEYLTMVDKVKVRQLYEIRELVLDYESKNKYVILNANDEQIYYAFEETGLCERLCCGSNRGFTIHIVDNFKREVLRISRPFKCCGGGCYGICGGVDCCSFECIIEAPPGNVIGYLKQRGAFCASSFNIVDADNGVVLKTDGPCCCVMWGCSDVDFLVTTPNGTEVGAVTKRWGGCVKEAFTDADTFTVSFPMDLEVRAKALLIAGTFLIDFMEFEKPPKNN